MTAAKPRRTCRCGHAEHVKACRARGRSRCVRVETGDGGAAMVCGARPPCPCAWRVCPCGTPVALAAELPADAVALPSGDVIIVSVERGSAGDGAGRVAVRELASGHLACRDLADGEDPAAGEWRGREHRNEDCKLLARAEADARWITLAA
jgi:hypothetical protein